MRACDAEDFNDLTATLPLLTMGSNITFSCAEIVAYYTARVPKLLQRRSGESRSPCPIHQGKENNFAVNMKTGEWFCHSQCGRGGDIFALEAALTNRDFPTCKEEVLRLVGREPGSGRNVAGGSIRRREDPKDDRSPHTNNSQQGAPQHHPLVPAAQVRENLARDGFHSVAEYQYSPRLSKVRFEHESNQQEGKNRPEKTFRWEHQVNGVWYSGDGDLPKPLYINDAFRERDQVEFAIGFEGEAKADIAGRLGLAAFSFKNLTASQVPSLTDCHIVLWRDNDNSGLTQAENAAALLLGNDQIRSVRLLVPPSALPEGGDIVDAVEMLGWDGPRIRQILETARDYRPKEPKPSDEQAAEASRGDGKKQSQLLVECAEEVAFFHTPEGEAFACLPVGGHREIWPLKSKACRFWLVRAFYKKVGRPPGNQALQEALGVLEAKAQFDSPESPVFTRVAQFGSNIYLDLGNDRWEAVEITPAGWNIVQSPPVHFRRSKGMQSLPNPALGSPISNLRSLVNIGDDRNWVLLMSWLISAFRPQGPHPLLILQGEQGSAKSTTAKLVRKLVDPVTAPLRTPPRDERDLVIAAKNSWMVAFDNLSSIPPWLSDGLCRLATGGGFSTRELYTDTEEVIIDVMRPVILNGIDHLAERPDLADRAVILNLPVIEVTARRDEAELYESYERERPCILGALLTAVSAALSCLPEVSLPSKPRMADFAIWATAAEKALEFPPNAFMDAYAGNRAEAVQETLESDPVSAAVIALLNKEEIDGQWTGTAKDLLQTLDANVEDKVKRAQEWPKTARGMASRLRRLATFLREAGIRVTFEHKTTGGRRPLTIRRTVGDSIATSATTAAKEAATSSNQPITTDSRSGGRTL